MHNLYVMKLLLLFLALASFCGAELITRKVKETTTTLSRQNGYSEVDWIHYQTKNGDKTILDRFNSDPNHDKTFSHDMYQLCPIEGKERMGCTITMVNGSITSIRTNFQDSMIDMSMHDFTEDGSIDLIQFRNNWELIEAYQIVAGRIEALPRKFIDSKERVKGKNIEFYFEDEIVKYFKLLESKKQNVKPQKH